jgi:hypothetical protein
MSWWWPWHRNGTREERARAERIRDEAKRRTARVERAAERFAQLPPDEFADRVGRAFRRRQA